MHRVVGSVPFELGLGAGAMWDRVATMGGPRRSPGEGVDALSEAIDIVRLAWSGEESASSDHAEVGRPGIRAR